MNKKYFYKMQLLTRQIQSINRVMIQSMNEMEVIRDNEADGIKESTPEKEVDKIQQLSAAIVSIAQASSDLDKAEKFLSDIISG